VTLAYVFGLLAAVFIGLAAARAARDAGTLGPQSRTWLIIGMIFAAVSFWLWTSQVS